MKKGKSQGKSQGKKTNTVCSWEPSFSTKKIQKCERSEQDGSEKDA